MSAPRGSHRIRRIFYHRRIRSIRSVIYPCAAPRALAAAQLARWPYLLVTEDHFLKAISSPSIDRKSSKASGSLEEKRVINPTPQGQTDGEGFELSPNSKGNQRNLASLVINPTQERHVDAWIRLVNALGYIDDERIIALAEHVENVRGIAEQNV
jgi:hypothetical protein